MQSGQLPVVIDNGTGYTKMGFASNFIPAFDIPTTIAYMPSKSALKISKQSYEELDFYIGDDAYQHSQTHAIVNPMKHGVVEDWTLMEKFWHRSIYDHLSINPEDHVFVLTEPPLNPPQNREQLAQIFFQTFNVRGLYVGVQAVLALYSANKGMTGTVMDSGDGVTHVIPISDGFVIGSCIKSIPLAGSDITEFIANMLRERGQRIALENLRKAAKYIKEKHCYVVEDGDLAKELSNIDRKLATNPNIRKVFRRVELTSQINKQKYSFDVGYERFLGPELFFHPEFHNHKFRKPIDQVIDESIQSCPMDTLRGLYSNIVLSGGSTLFEGLVKRLQNSIQNRVDKRLQIYGKKMSIKPSPIKVSVQENDNRRYAVWQGGSQLACSSIFSKLLISREEYWERGSGVARKNVAML